MNTPKLNLNDLEYFFEDYKREIPILVLIKIIFSYGIYIFVWIYKMNQQLERVDEMAPDSRRGFFILFLIPIVIFVISIVIEKLFQLPNYTIATYNAIFWSINIFLSLKYIYDFCESFGKWTGSNGLFWYLVIYPGYFSVILYFLDFLYVLPLLFFTIIAIPSMQGFLNIKEIKFRAMFERDQFNKKSRVQI